MADALVAHVAPGQPSQLVVDERREALERSLIPASPRYQQLGQARVPGFRVQVAFPVGNARILLSQRQFSSPLPAFLSVWRMARRLVWAAWLAGPLADTPVHAQAPTLTVRVRNDARVPDRILAEAEAFVTRTYAVAGVDVAWLPRVADVTLVTLPREGAERMHQAPDCMGYAPAAGSQGGRLAYVLQHRVDAVARGYGAQQALVLGAALGHELGHLLLPPHSHSASGLMRAQWNQADFREAGQGRLLLAPEQAAQIRTLLISRLALVASQRFVLGIERLEHR